MFKSGLHLMKGFEDSVSHLYTDNIYTFHALYNHLYNRGINACGKVRSNRSNFPNELVTKATPITVDLITIYPMGLC